MWLDLSSIDGAPNATSTASKGRKIAVLVMIDTATRYMAARTIPDETSGSLRKALECEWIRIFGPPKQLSVDEWSGWGSDEISQWAGEHAIEMRISPGQAAEKIPFLIHGLGWSSQSSLLDSALSQSEHLRQWLHSND